MTDANAPCGLFYCGGRCWFRVTGLTMVYLVRIVPTSAAKPPAFPRKNEGFEATLATHWTTHQEARQRTRRRSTCKHARAWTCRKAKAIGQKCEKPWENLWFCSGEDRNRTFGCFPNVFWVVRILPLCSISIEVETMRRTTASPTRA